MVTPFPLNVTQVEAKSTAVLITIHPFVEGRLLRVGARMVKTKINYDVRHPVVLQHASHPTKWNHEGTDHSGLSFTLNASAEHFCDDKSVEPLYVLLMTELPLPHLRTYLPLPPFAHVTVGNVGSTFSSSNKR